MGLRITVPLSVHPSQLTFTRLNHETRVARLPSRVKTRAASGEAAPASRKPFTRAPRYRARRHPRIASRPHSELTVRTVHAVDASPRDQ